MKHIFTEYKLRKIGAALKSGRAWIEGLVCDGDRWPEGNHYYIVQVGEKIEHVICSARPTWRKYL